MLVSDRPRESKLTKISKTPMFDIWGLISDI